jgi:outer membrane protein OmpA-like peptidoglycan-associated protein
MKNILRISIFIFALTMIPKESNAQFWKKIKKNVEKKINKEAESRTTKRTDKGIDKTFDALEEGIDGKNKEDSNSKTKQSNKSKNSTSSDSQSNNSSNSSNYNRNGNDSGNYSGSDNTEAVAEAVPENELSWARFDFVPGDQVIFEDGPNPSEENGEFPSRWDLYEGNAEIVKFNGEKVIAFPKGGSIVPYLKNSNEDYLPDVFTIEFDIYFSDKGRRCWLNFSDRKNKNNARLKDVTIYKNKVTFDATSNGISEKLKSGWRHVSIAFTKGKLKVYLDDTRLINIPRFKGNPTGLTIKMDGYNSDKINDMQYVKNIRIAKGGVKYYDRVLSEGKIIVNGIRFEVGKSNIKPESMGAINKIYELMDENPDVNFSVEGHTDSDGDEKYNQKLSVNRAKAVMDKLISMGISANRLKYTGFGESKPIETNGTEEGRANNRRVEFVKF